MRVALGEASRDASLDLQSLDEKADHIAKLVMSGEISEEEAHEIEDKLIRAQERLELFLGMALRPRSWQRLKWKSAVGRSWRRWLQCLLGDRFIDSCYS